jgi:hypothetical protein
MFFLFDLFNSAFNSLDYIVSVLGWIMNILIEKDMEGSNQLPIVSYCHDICLETLKTLSGEPIFRLRIEPGPPEYRAQVLTSQL